jgi:hypothetical protein
VKGEGQALAFHLDAVGRLSLRRVGTAGYLLPPGQGGRVEPDPATLFAFQPVQPNDEEVRHAAQVGPEIVKRAPGNDGDQAQPLRQGAEDVPGPGKRDRPVTVLDDGGQGPVIIGDDPGRTGPARPR